MVLNLAQRVFRYAKMRNFFQFARTMPVLNTILLPQLNRYFVGRILIMIGVVTPFLGLFRRAYIKNKFNQYLLSKTETAELELKQSLQKFDIKMPKEVDYMIIVHLQQFTEEEEISQADKENSSKIFTLLEQAQNFPQSRDIKWAFLGSRRLFEIIQEGRNSQRNQKENISIEFYEYQKSKKQSKVFLLARDGEGQKVIMQWNAGVPLKEISKYIARHKYKKYLQEINF